MMQIVFLCSLFLLIGSFLVYPLALSVIAIIVGKKSYLTLKDYSFFPYVTIIVAAYNEEAEIEEKIKNTLLLDYPHEKLEIIVVSDASTDKTDEIVRRYYNQGIKLIRIEGRRGKTYCQNVATSLARGEIIVYSDANALYSPDSINELVRYFIDPSIGVVIGKRTYHKPLSTKNQESMYEKYETFLKFLESRIGGTIGANGPMYALRKELYIPLADDVISDIIEPLLIAIKHHKKVIQAEKAISVERHENDCIREFKRKRRIALRTMNSLWSIRTDLLKRPGLLIKLIFHKILKWMTLPLLLICAVSGILTGEYFNILISMLIVAYLLIGCILLLLCYKVQGYEKRLNKGGGILLYSFVMFSASLCAFIDFLFKKRIIIWQTRQ